MRIFFKFFCTGVLNTALDFTVLNVLVFLFGTGDGNRFVFFKGLSFLVAVANSYVWNKWWVFKHDTAVSMRESLRFFIVSCVGLVLNVSVSFALFVFFAGKVPSYIAANIGALAGTVVVFAWNFAGYRFFVFGQTYG